MPKAKSHDAVDLLIDTLQEIADASGWSFHLVSGAVKGPFKPFWGMGFGYIPREEELLKGDVTFYPRMVSSKCNGYFKVYDTKYATKVKEFLGQGVWPSFTIDTYKKGIQVNIHPKCETLQFIFDLKMAELASYEIYATRAVSFMDTMAFLVKPNTPDLKFTLSCANSLKWHHDISITLRCMMKASITNLFFPPRLRKKALHQSEKLFKCSRNS